MACRACLALLLLAAGAGLWIALPGRAAQPRVELKAKEFLYEPKEVTAPPGGVVFVVRNVGAIEHNFVLEDAVGKKVVEIAVIEPGATAEVAATISPGAYTIVCTLPGHRQAGMVATLKVAK
jgi:high-affinity iron transporter